MSTHTSASRPVSPESTYGVPGISQPLKNSEEDGEKSRYPLFTIWNHNASPTTFESDHRALKFDNHSKCVLRRPSYVMVLFIAYVLCALVAWILVVVMSFKPLTGEIYKLDSHAPGHRGYRPPFPLADLLDYEDYITNEHLFTLARFLQSAVSVVTVPLASTVCAQAAVVWMQRASSLDQLSLRKTMSLSDKDWTTLSIYLKLLTQGNTEVAYYTGQLD